MSSLGSLPSLGTAAVSSLLDVLKMLQALGRWRGGNGYPNIQAVLAT